MVEPEHEQHQVSRKVVTEHVNSTSTGTSVAAWVIIAVIAIALLAYILTRTF